MKKTILILGLLTLLISAARTTLFTAGEYSWRRIKSPDAGTEYTLEVPKEYRGVVRKLYDDSEGIRLEGIQEIVTIVTEKESNKSKREALALQLVNKLRDRQETVQEKAALALRRILPSCDEGFQILLGFEVVEGLGNPEEYVRWSTEWGLKKIISSLGQETRKAIALRIVDRWLYSPLRYASWSATVALEKILDYLNYDSQKAVVEKMQENLTSEEEYKREVTVKAFTVIIPLLKTKVVEDLAIDLKDILEKTRTANRKSVRAVAFIAKTLFPYLHDHHALKEELEIEIGRLLPQP